MKLTHPDSKQTIEVPSDREALYASQGWERPKPTPKPPKK